MRLLLFIAAVSLLGTGCQNSQPVAEVVEPAAEEPEADRKPFMFAEADRPEDWPALTTVGKVEVKQYPAYRAAFVSEADANRPGQNGMFRVLFNHIKRNDIAMTAPVEMTYDNDDARPTAMGFMYRTPTMGETGEDGVVDIRDVPAETVVSTGVRGDYNEDNYKVGLARIEAWLSENPNWQANGSPRYLGYNSPFVPWFFKYGEVQVPIKAKP